MLKRINNLTLKKMKRDFSLIDNIFYLSRYAFYQIMYFSTQDREIEMCIGQRKERVFFSAKLALEKFQ